MRIGKEIRVEKVENGYVLSCYLIEKDNPFRTLEKRVFIDLYDLFTWMTVNCEGWDSPVKDED